MKSKFIFPIISIIQILMGVGLLVGVFLDPVGLIQPFFNGEISADLIFFSQGIIDVTAMHMIGVGLLFFSLWRLKFDNESNKVFHYRFGKGFIVEARDDDLGEDVVLVQFDSGHRKKVFIDDLEEA